MSVARLSAPSWAAYSVIKWAAIGSRAGREDEVGSREIRRCEQTPSGPPDYWDVSYHFRGQEHRVQMSAPPGPTLVVNADGIPRQ
ncbi:hypothetical protein GCM10028811_06380 [Uliginosibacterium sediminicola]